MWTGDGERICAADPTHGKEADMSRPTQYADPKNVEARASETPEMLKAEMSDPTDPSTIGGANAEANGVWRVLRNSAVLAVVAMAVIAVVYTVAT
ncbi:MAG: hypothetical protein CML46_10075 [Rhodobacteraceae bacterium]|nr:hypothetical protein [Paracoccaceae bacterium]MBR27273.1 hypothetical protein [Paracoccaceae bacterium]